MLRFALKNMLVKRVKLLLVVLSIVLSAGVGLLAANVSMQVREGIVDTAAYYDIIIGPSGSATQLAMNTMFFTDSPLGTIPYALAEELAKSPDVNQVVPFTMGDSFGSARVVGTTPAFLEGKSLGQGAMFDGEYEAVIGAGVAGKYGLCVGDTMVTSHGLTGAGSEHAANPLTVTGILRATHTSYDNAVFTSYKTVWAVHGGEAHGEDEEEAHGEHEAEPGQVCAILVKTKSPAAYYAISTYYAQDSSLLVINPSTVLREVLDNVDTTSQIVYLLCGVILIMNIFVVSVITLLNMVDAKREIALMRLIGIRMGRIALMYAVQNIAVGLLSTLLAFGASMLCLGLMGGLVAEMGIVLNPTRVYPLEFAIMALVFLISVLPTFCMSWFMARRDGLDDE